MTATPTSLEPSTSLQLIALASEKSSEKRLQLLRGIADTFAVESEGASTTVQYLIDEIVTKLLDRIQCEDRASASDSLAKMPRLPESVAKSLAYDSDFAVARPIIKEYRGLSNIVLVDLASTGSQTYLEAIAGRASLETDVTDIVVQRGNGQVVRTLAANRGARFSRFGMRTMIRKAEDDERLQELLVDRVDLSLESVAQLLPLVSQQLAAKLNCTDLSLNSTIVQDQVVSWVSDRKKSIAQVNRSIERIRGGAEKLDDALMALLTERRILDIATVIAGVGDLDREYAFNLVTQGRTDNVVVLLRSLAVTWPTAEAILKLRIDKLGSQMCGPMVNEQDYEIVDIAGAQRVMRFLKVRRAAMAQEKAAAAS